MTINYILAFVFGLVWGYFSKVVVDFFREAEDEAIYR